VFNILLQVLDDGRLTDNQGRTVSFKNAILVMTSNVAADYIQAETAGIGEFNRDVLWENVKKNVLERLRQTMRPEFLNRIDEIIMFSSLNEEEIRQIVRLQLVRLQKLLIERDVQLDVTDAAVDLIAKAGYDPTYGARPLKRYIGKHLSQEIAKEILAGRLNPGQQLRIDAANDAITFTAVGGPKETTEEETVTP